MAAQAAIHASVIFVYAGGIRRALSAGPSNISPESGSKRLTHSGFMLSISGPSRRAGGAVDERLIVYRHAIMQIARDADVEHAIAFAGSDIDAGFFHRAHAGQQIAMIHSRTGMHMAIWRGWPPARP
jgi:hypothetical protein